MFFLSRINMKPAQLMVLEIRLRNQRVQLYNCPTSTRGVAEFTRSDDEVTLIPANAAGNCHARRRPSALGAQKGGRLKGRFPVKGPAN